MRAWSSTSSAGRWTCGRSPIRCRHPTGVVVEVHATGLCRSDWHAWAGHDDGVALPHVPGHELVGVVVASEPRCGGGRSVTA